MSILPQAPQRTLRSIAAHLLPGSCLLCASNSATSLLCPACTADLPQLPAALCPQCGEETTLGERCGACLKDPPAFARTIALFRYEFPVDRLIQALKYGHQLALAGWGTGSANGWLPRITICCCRCRCIPPACRRAASTNRSKLRELQAKRSAYR